MTCSAARAPSDLYIGLMSGTSLDGVDGVLTRLADGAPPQILAAAHLPMPPALHAAYLALQQRGDDELHREALAANALARLYADCVAQLLAAANVAAAAVTAIGAHGQTIRHQPQLHDGTGYTRQSLAAALLAELTGIDVVADLRSRDVAAGGQGAPLVPGFHQAVFGTAGATRVVCNIGGFSNLSVLHRDGRVTGFDCGPGNVLLDYWARTHLGRPYDDGGAWAATGTVCAPLLDALLAEPYFAAAPPKSTGRDLFDPNWLAARLKPFEALAPADVQATLTELSARAIANDLQRYAPDCGQLLVCGGGAFNATLIRRLGELLAPIPVAASDTLAMPAEQVEALAFAWLAQRFCTRQPGNVAAVTGASGPRTLGALYPA